VRVLRPPPLLPLLLLVLLVLPACAGWPTDAPAPARRLGGPVPERHEPPVRAMNSVERPVANRLARRIAHDGLTLEHLDCPPWHHELPAAMTCTAYVDGLVAHAEVTLTASDQDTVLFDSRLTDGVVATRLLERTLRRQRWEEPDCGDVAAYPALPASRIRCRAVRSGQSRYVVATVRDRSGGVSLTVERGAVG
jgi:hypothetical protein